MGVRGYSALAYCSRSYQDGVRFLGGADDQKSARDEGPLFVNVIWLWGYSRRSFAPFVEFVD